MRRMRRRSMAFMVGRSACHAALMSDVVMLLMFDVVTGGVAVAFARHPREGGDPGTFHAFPVHLITRAIASASQASAEAMFQQADSKAQKRSLDSGLAEMTTCRAWCFD